MARIAGIKAKVDARTPAQVAEAVLKQIAPAIDKKVREAQAW